MLIGTIQWVPLRSMHHPTKRPSASRATPLPLGMVRDFGSSGTSAEVVLVIPILTRPTRSYAVAIHNVLPCFASVSMVRGTRNDESSGRYSPELGSETCIHVISSSSSDSTTMAWTASMVLDDAGVIRINSPVDTFIREVRRKPVVDSATTSWPVDSTTPNLPSSRDTARLRRTVVSVVERALATIGELGSGREGRTKAISTSDNTTLVDATSMVTLRAVERASDGVASIAAISLGWRHWRSCMGNGARKGFSPVGSSDASAIDSNTSCVPFISVVECLGYADHVTTRHFVDSNDTWLELTAEVLDVGAAYEWAIRPSCGAVVVFSGTVRDHSDGRSGVHVLSYEAYEEAVVPKLAAVAQEMRRQWATIGRIALIHRVGELALGESSVLVVVSAPHRPEAFDAARFGIDALKATVPIWKRESWSDGGDWALGAQHVTDLATFADERSKASR